MRFFMATMLTLSPGLAMAASLTSFDVPGFPSTCVTAIASNGLTAGYASNLAADTAGNLAARRTPANPKNFVFINGHLSFPKPDVPAGSQFFEGINRDGALVGVDLTATLQIVSFVFEAGKTSFASVAQGSNISLSGITDRGTLLGSASFPTGGVLKFNTLAFLLKKSGKLTVLDDGTGFMTPLGVDESADRAVGYSISSTGLTGWVYFAGSYEPLAVPGAIETLPYAVDSQGRVSGTYVTGTTTNAVEHGFIFDNGTYATWDIPGAASTGILAANQSGQLAGCYTDAKGTHGFIATP